MREEDKKKAGKRRRGREKPTMMRAHQTVGESAARHTVDEAGSIQEGKKKKRQCWTVIQIIKKTTMS